MVEQRGAALALRIESIGHEHDALRARFGRRAQLLGLRVEIVADVPGRDDRHAPGHPLDHEAREFRAFGQAQELHLARLRDREQRIGAVRQIPFDEPFGSA